MTPDREVRSTCSCILRQILKRPGRLSPEDRVRLLGATDPAEAAAIREAAGKVALENCGPEVYYRGLIEISNICRHDCFYCGIRQSNPQVRRYTLDENSVLEQTRWCADQGYGSVVLQSGERQDEAFIELVERLVRRIKQETRSDKLPQGLGITLSVGEQTLENYRRLFSAGAHRYLLRIETSNPQLFARIHPPGQTFESRRACLGFLRTAGFQVGTGVMVGLPGQTIADLADDIGFFVEQDVDMVGMGPFIPHEATPLWGQTCPDPAGRIHLALLMIAVTRLSRPDINIAATTALQALDPLGREQGLLAGANIIMPLLTPAEARHDYLLYPGKPCLDETAAHCRNCLEARINATGRRVGYNQWGDSPHALSRRPRTN